MKGDRRMTPEVSAMKEIDFSYGHVIPHSWREVFAAKDGGRLDFAAMYLLAEVVFWYRPKVKKDADGRVTFERRFDADVWQKSYGQIVTSIGCTKKQARMAVKKLADMGLIKTELRSLQIGRARLSNVLYIRAVPSEIKKITHPKLRS